MADQDPSLTTGNTIRGLPPIETLPEWNLLSGADVAATPEASAQVAADTSAEAKRTRAALNVMRYGYEGGDNNYAALTEAQEETVKLQRSEFDEFHEWAHDAVGNEEAYEASQYIMIIHDVGKSQRIYEGMGLGVHDLDHDEALTELLNNSTYDEARRNLLPSFDQLSPTQRQLVKDVFSVRLNLGQFMQAEAPAASLEGFPEDLPGKVRDIYMLHAICDIAGVTGHVNETSSLVFTSPTYRSMAAAQDALSRTDISGPVARYDAYLGTKAEQFGLATTNMDAQQLAEAKAQVRLGSMQRISGPEDFAQLQGTFNSQSDSVKAILTTELNKTGVDDRATLPYYGPALLRAVVEKVGSDYALTYFAHVLQEAHIADRAAREAGEVGVITADLGNLTRGINQNTIDPRNAQIKFSKQGNMLVPEVVQTDSVDTKTLPLLEGQ